MNYPIHLTTLLGELVTGETKFQRLDQSFVSGKLRRDGLDVTFGTEKAYSSLLTPFGIPTVGALIVWYDTAKWDEVCQRLKPGTGTEAQRAITRAKEFLAGPMRDSQDANRIIGDLLKELEKRS